MRNPVEGVKAAESKRSSYEPLLLLGFFPPGPFGMFGLIDCRYRLSCLPPGATKFYARSIRKSDVPLNRQVELFGCLTIG